jgi:hypothetical protein
MLGVRLVRNACMKCMVLREALSDRWLHICGLHFFNVSRLGVSTGGVQHLNYSFRVGFGRRVERLEQIHESAERL